MKAPLVVVETPAGDALADQHQAKQSREDY
jgi:hypothetical protein